LQRDTLKTFAAEISRIIPQLAVTSEEETEKLVSQSIISKSRDKELKLTQTFCSNYLIKLFFKLKELKITEDMKTFIETIRASI
jgi:hypothetical protein